LPTDSANPTHLFEPITLRGLTVRNRIWLPAMCQYSSPTGTGMPGHWHLVHLGARATGGFGLLITEAAAIVPEGRISPQDAGLWNDAQRDAWRPIVDFVHGQGAAIAVQLAHAGRKAGTYRGFVGEPTGVAPASAGGWEPVGPSTLPYPGLATPRELTTGEVAEVSRAFAAAARRAVDAGFDTVQLHAAHGYLLHEFLSPISNRRTDAYGGDLAGRAKLLLDTVDLVRAELGEDRPLLVRMSATEWLDEADDSADPTVRGLTLNDAVTVAGWLAERGVDMIDVSSSGNTPARIPVGPGYQVPLAARIKAELAARAQSAGASAAGVVPAIGTVGLITEPVQAESLLVTGQADIALIGRAALREPAWPQRAAHELGLDWHAAPYPPQYTRGRW
jgi:2,4-dienoyl-CoA reductase-like NADH-dependent reductase (Old Yellow Enzyme family)